MLDVIVGTLNNPQAAQALRNELHDKDLEGTLYIGYPVLSTVDGSISIDGLLCSREHGLVAFDFETGRPPEKLRREQDDIYAAIFQKLFQSRSLREGRGALSVPIRVVTIDPASEGAQNESDVIPPPRIFDYVRQGDPLDLGKLRHVNAAIERVTTLKPPARREVTRADSRGALMKQIEKEIANLDRWQKTAAIESPEGPQRVRGLAGSGKTIVLALKAAYLHTQNPDWQIGVTFHTRSLYQQFIDLIRRFTFDTIRDEPDWSQLKVLHSWGSSSRPGVYSTIAMEGGAPVRDFSYGRHKYGYTGAFEGVCKELLGELNGAAVPLFDALLIDEAQDLPAEFFQLSYLATRTPHRVVWAYDELQNLTRQSMPPFRELFGNRLDGEPRVEHLSSSESPRQDIVLPVCYRNTPWALSTAHALGFGIYRDGGLVQFFDEPDLWEDIGYEIVAGAIEPERHVELRRGESSYPKYFKELLDPADAISTHVFESPEAEAYWVAEQVEKNLSDDELRPRDIMVILCNALTQQRDAAPLVKALSERDIPAHLAGVTSSVDALFRDDSVALTGIFRAKGNEAPMVYVMGAQYGAGGLELIRRRNVLFTAITRSRAWVRVSGVGDSMQRIEQEVKRVVEHNYSLDFTVPSQEKLEDLRRIHRDRPSSEKSQISKAEEEFRQILSRIEAGELPPDIISDELLEAVRRIRTNFDE